MEHNKRQLNIELMRIFAMLLILVWHIRGHYIPEAGVPQDTTEVTALTYFCLFITFHVNLFVLITGFFGIRDRKKSLIKTIEMCIFYAVVLNILSYLTGNGFNWQEILMPISHSPWWFMQVYLILILIAPIFEKYISNITNTEFYVLVTIFLFLDVYLSFFWHADNLYGHGYDILNFTTIYILGAWIRRDCGFICHLRKNPLMLLLLFLACCIIRYKVQPITTIAWTDYNSPLNIAMAVTIFCLFLNIKVPALFEKTILLLSTSAVSVYLITDHPEFRKFILPLFQYLWIILGNNAWYFELFYVVALVIILFIICCLFDKIRIWLTSPLVNLITCHKTSELP